MPKGSVNGQLLTSNPSTDRMTSASLKIRLGPDFLESRVLTWKHDGLIILPSGNATLPNARVSTYGSGSLGYEILGSVWNHLLWFTVYYSDNTSFLGGMGEPQVEEYLIGDLIYARNRLTHTSGRKLIPLGETRSSDTMFRW